METTTSSPAATAELAASEQELATQLQGLHQLHIQLETVIAYFEGREPDSVPVFGEYSNFQLPPSRHAAASSPSLLAPPPSLPSNDDDLSTLSAGQAHIQFQALLGQLSSIQNDFDQLQKSQHHSTSTSAAASAEERQTPYNELSDDGDGDDSTSITSVGSAEQEEVRLLLQQSGGGGPQEEMEEEDEEQRTNFKPHTHHQQENTPSQVSFYRPENEEDTCSASPVLPIIIDGEESLTRKQTSTTSSSASVSGAAARLQMLQARRRLESQDAEIKKLQSHVKQLETQLLHSAAPKAVMMQAAEVQKRNVELLTQLKAAQAALIAREESLQQQGHEEIRNPVFISATAAVESSAATAGVVQEAERLRKRVHVLEAQNAKFKSQMEFAAKNEATKRLSSSSLLHGDRSRRSSSDAQTMNSTESNQTAELSSSHQIALAQWEEGKKLHRRIETLKTKLHQQSSTQASLQAELTRVKSELEQSQASGTTLRSQLKALQARTTAKESGTVPAQAMQTLLKELEALQLNYDILERQCATLSCSSSAGPSPSPQKLVRLPLEQKQLPGNYSASAPVSPAAAHAASINFQQRGQSTEYIPARYSDDLQHDHHHHSSSSGATAACKTEEVKRKREIGADLKILDLELERDQANARAMRLQQRLDFLFKELETGGGKRSSLPSAEKTRKGGGGGSSSSREKELLDTISLLRAALEKTRKGLENGVSSAKYMQAVEKVRQLTLRVRHLEVAVKEAEEHRQRVISSQKEIAEAQVLISALRGQLKDAKRRRTENSAAREQIMNAQVAELERAVRERDAQIAVLKHPACEEARALVAEGMTPKMVVQELISCRAELAAATEREASLRSELAPFDGTFFAELHQLKREHEELRLLSVRGPHT